MLRLVFLSDEPNLLGLAMKAIITLIACVLVGGSAYAQEAVASVPWGASVSAIPSSDAGEQRTGGDSTEAMPSSPRLNRERTIYIGLSAFDAIYSARMFATHPHLREGSLGRGLEQAPAKFLATKAAAIVGTVVVLRVLERSHPKIARAMTWGFVGLESAVLVHNYRVTR